MPARRARRRDRRQRGSAARGRRAARRARIAAQPGAHRRPHRLSARAPHAARRDLDGRDEEARGGGERGGVDARPPLVERHTERGGGPRLLLEQRPPRRRPRPRDRRPPAGAPTGCDSTGAARGAPQRRPQRERVPRRHEVQRLAHQRHPHGLARGGHAGELLRVEALETGPQADVGSVRHLRLHADEPLDHVAGGGRRSRRERLPFEQCSIQFADGQDLVAHRRERRFSHPPSRLTGWMSYTTIERPENGRTRHDDRIRARRSVRPAPDGGRPARDPPARLARRAGHRRRPRAAAHREDPAREPAAPCRHARRQRRRRAGPRGVARRRRRERRVHARARPDAGLHRRAGGGGPRRDAQRGRRAGGDPRA